MDGSTSTHNAKSTVFGNEESKSIVDFWHIKKDVKKYYSRDGLNRDQKNIIEKDIDTLYNVTM